MIVNAKTAPGVDRLQHNPFTLQLAYQFRNPLHRFAKRLGSTNLRTNMNTDSVRFQPAVSCHALVNFQRLANINPKLVLAQTGGDVGVRVGKNIRIHAQGKASNSFELAGACGELYQFSLALNVELKNTRRKRQIDLSHCLANAGKDHPSGGFRRSGKNALRALRQRQCQSPRRDRRAA